jgi:hypothetical protein
VITVACFDPGRTTGHAVGVIEDGRMVVRCGQLDFDHIMLYQQLSLLSPDMVICEEFEFRNRARKGLDLYPRELLGVCELYCQQRKIALFRQKAMEGMGFYTNEKLQRDGLYIRGKPHAMDALRHLLHWYTFGYGFQFNTSGYISQAKA